MEGTEIILTKEQEDLFNIGNKAYFPDLNETWSYFPYWIKKDSNGRTFVVSPEKLPERMTKMLNDMKDGNKTVKES